MKLPHHLATQIIHSLGDIFWDRRYADKAVEFAFKHHPKWGSRDRRLFAETIYEIVRWWRWYWHLAGLPDQEHGQQDKLSVERLWQVWAAYWITTDHELPPFDEVADVKPSMVRERAGRSVSPAVRASLPDWLHDRLAQDLGEEWPAVREALNEPAGVYLRVNTLKVDRRSLRERLGQDGYITEAVKAVPSALLMPQRQNIYTMAAFKEGLFEVQDAASQLIAPFLEPEPGQRVIDACAGGGGKALHLAALMQNKGRIMALDVHAWKLDNLRKRASRAGIDVIETRPIESAKTVKRLAGTADRVLLDVPCSGLGVLRRNPDAKWKLSLEEINRLIIEQQDILTRYSQMVKPGGKLVYATCSILPAENEQQVERFLSTHGETWTLEEELKLTPSKHGFDGFYAARLKKAE